MKQLEPVKKTIDGINFYISQFPALKAANLTGELASVLAPLLGVIAPLIGGNESLLDADAEKIGNAMANCTGISGDKIELLVRKLLLGGNIAVEEIDDYGKTDFQRLDEDVLNEIFCGNVQNMFILCYHVIALNFDGFFKKLAAPSGKEESQKVARKII